MGFLDFFKNMFKKQNCTFCGKECGVMGRDKIKGDEYICNECRRGASKYIRVGRLTKDELAGHMEYMKRCDKIFNEVIGGWNKTSNYYPTSPDPMSFVFFDDFGMFVIRDRNMDNRPVEVIRYDQVASYEPYFEERDAAEGGKKEFVEAGVKIKLIGGLDVPEEIRKGGMGHPYIVDPIKVCIAKGINGERNAMYVDNIIAHFDHIFGVHDNDDALFSFGMNEAEKRNLKAGVAFVNTFVDAVKVAKAGEEALTDEKKAEIQANMNAMNDAQTGGLAVYTRRADEAEAKVQ